MKHLKYLLLFLIPALYSCADKTDISQFNTDAPGNVSGDTVYVELSPEWTGFNNPQDIYIGKEPFIYVADTDNDRIVMLNIAGQVLGSRSIKKPVAIGQDFKLNLIVCAEFDTLINGAVSTFSGVFKFDMVAAGHDISSAPVKRILPVDVDSRFAQRKYTGVAAFYDNSYYIARTGPKNEIIDPDNSLLIMRPRGSFEQGDTLINRVANIDPLSTGLVSAYNISSLSVFNKKNYDFVATLISNNSFKTQWFNLQVTAEGERYVSRFSPSDGVQLGTPNRFLSPQGSWVDNSGNIYVADSEKDSVFKFNQYGEELQSFGGAGVFEKPYGVAVFDKILYVVDAGKNKILRFSLSTDIQ